MARGGRLMNALLVINARSGGVERIGVEAIRDMAVRIFNEHGDAKLAVKTGEVDELIAAIKNMKNLDVVICAGGDGAQAAVASALLNSKTALLPLPCGTVNELCRDLKIPLNIEEALKHALNGATKTIDVGRIGERVFLNNVVFGAYAELAEAREVLREATTLDDVSFSIIDAVNALTHADPIRFQIELNGEKTGLQTNTIAVSNNAITSAERLIPHRDRLDEGKLYAYLVEARDGRDFAALLAAFARGEADASEQIDALACSKCRISAPKDSFSYTIDGDPVETNDPVEIEIVPKALKVLAPAAPDT